MAYDWSIISAQRSPEEAYYRLLGEMLHRHASADDLQRIRDFLGGVRLGDEVWLSLGEGLFHTTAGASVGYRMWCAWSRVVLREEFDEAHQLEAWRRLQTGTSDGLEQTSEPEPPTVSFDPELPDYPDVTTEDRTERTRVIDVAEGQDVERLAQEPSAAISLIPSGPHTIRMFGEVFERVDEFALLNLLRTGVFFELEVLFGIRWIKVIDHPGFVSLVHRLRQDAIAELATTERARPEVTQPGAR